MASTSSCSEAGSYLRRIDCVERLRENLSGFNAKCFQDFIEFVPESFRWTGFMSRPGTKVLNF